MGIGKIDIYVLMTLKKKAVYLLGCFKSLLPQDNKLLP